MEPGIWAFIGTVVGAITSILTTLSVNWNEFRIKKSNKLEDRKERSRVFQRDTALELQSELIEFMRCHFLSRQEDLRNLVETGSWGSLPGSEVEERAQASRSKTFLLIERISDDELRMNLKYLTSNSWKCMVAESKTESDELDMTTDESYGKASEMLGVVLRLNL